MVPSPKIQPDELARIAVTMASEKLASDIVMLDLIGVSDFTDFFIILTAESTRQMNAITDDIQASIEAQNANLHHREGNANSGWILLDFGDLIVHIFSTEQREYYDIESVWDQGTETVRIQ